jgi:hypothetical protein
MHVQVAPNWADIEGTISATTESTQYQGFTILAIDLRAVRPVEGFACMVKLEDRKVDVAVPSEIVRDLKLAAGDLIACRVRRAGPQKLYFVDRQHVRRLEK